MLSVACILCFVLFWMTGRWFNIPVFRGFDVRLFGQPNALVVLLILAALFAAAAAVGGLVGCRVRREAGLFAACVGLAAISYRGGTIDRILLYSAGARRVYLLLALEAALLAALLALGWLILHLLERGRILRAEAEYDGFETDTPSRPAGYWALATQSAAMIVFVLVLAQSTDKMQVLVAVFAAAVGASLLAHWMFPVAESKWFLSGPVICAVLGYIFASFGDPALLAIGKPASNLAAPLPLDYLSAGPAGALAGYWLSRHWQAEKQAEQRESESAATP